MDFSPKNSNFLFQRGSHHTRIYCQRSDLCILNFLDQFSDHLLSASACYYFFWSFWLFILLILLFILFIFMGTRKWVTTYSMVGPYLLDPGIDCQQSLCTVNKLCTVNINFFFFYWSGQIWTRLVWLNLVELQIQYFFKVSI